MKHSNFKTNVHNLVLAAMFLALALVLPFLTGQIPQIGGMLLPMHRGPADADGAPRNAAVGGRCGHGL